MESGGITVALVALFVTLVFGLVGILWNNQSNTRRLEDKIDAVRQELGAKISDAEREQARQEGVNSVLMQHSYTHGEHPHSHIQHVHDPMETADD